MCPQFQAQIGPFSFSVRTDANGIELVRGPVAKNFGWDSIVGAVFVRPDMQEDIAENHQLEKAKQILGDAIDVEKIKAMRSSMGTVHIAYRDKGRGRHHEEIPVPIADADFLTEFQTKLGPRWMGEARDSHDAEKKLHTTPGMFKTLLFLFLFLAVLILGLAFGLFTLFAPVLNALSIRRMYEDFSDGDFASLGIHLLVYVGLFVFGYLLRKLWHARLEARRANRRSRTWQ